MEAATAQMAFWLPATANTQVLSLVIDSRFVFWPRAHWTTVVLSHCAPPSKPVRSVFAGALVFARTKASPGQQMSGVRKVAHVGANLGNDGLGTEFADAGMGAHDCNSGARGREVGVDLTVHRPSDPSRPFDQLQVELQQKTMMTCHAPVQCFLQSSSTL